MILEIISKDNKNLGQMHIRENNEYGELEVIETTNEIIDVSYSFDNYFETNEEKLIIEVDTEKKDHFLTLNYENIDGNTPRKCVPLLKELNSYCCLLKHYKNHNYRDVWILIQNYFGHIDYGKEFGYFKTHDEICDILLYNFFISHENEFKHHFLKFCKRQMENIVWRLQNKYNYNLEKDYIEKRINVKE